MEGTLSEEDRQCAWELYAEIITRVAVTGKRNDPSAEDFSGELLCESIESLHRFFSETRSIMRRFPVGKIGERNQEHLGVLICRILANVIRPFLETWHSDFDVWWKFTYKGDASPYVVQDQYARIEQLKAHWTDLRRMMRQVEHKLRDEYKLALVV